MSQRSRSHSGSSKRNGGKKRQKTQQQLSFFPPLQKFFGGSLMRGVRKKQRPLAFKRPLHIVLRSSKARGDKALLDYRNRHRIEKWLKDFARRNQVRIYEIAINWNHLHLLARFVSRAAYNKFIRSLTGTLPKGVLGFRDPTETFWDDRPFTRIVEWGRDYNRVKDYVMQNVLEALGLVSYQKRNQRNGQDPYDRWLKKFGAYG
jgi:REP element-mobilizing transposase RayT